MRPLEAGVKSILRRLSFLIGIGLLGFLAYQVIALSDALPEYFWQSDRPLLALSAAMVVAGHYLVALGWQLTLIMLGVKLSWLRAVHVFFYSNLMRYLPGSLWYMVGRVQLSQKRGVLRQQSGVSLVLEVCFLVVSAALLSSRVLVMRFDTLSAPVALAVSALLLLSLTPRVFARLANWVLKRTKREQITLDLRFQDMIVLLTPYMGSWVLYGLGLRVLLESLHPLGAPDLGTTISIYAASWVAGFLCVPIPQGMGVRDSVLAYLLSNYIPLSTASLAALTWRFWILLADLACVGLASALLPLSARRD